MREIDEVNRLKEFMEEWEASMEHVARNLGISSRTVFRWLHGQSKPTGVTLVSLRSYLDDVYPREEEENRKTRRGRRQDYNQESK